MLSATELQCLSHWCRQQGLSWRPALADDGAPALMLTPARVGVAQSCMMLVDTPHEWRLLDGYGEPMAAASRLGLLLDALDGGVGLGDDGTTEPRVRPGNASGVQATYAMAC